MKDVFSLHLPDERWLEFEAHERILEDIGGGKGCAIDVPGTLDCFAERIHPKDVGDYEKEF